MIPRSFIFALVPLLLLLVASDVHAATYKITFEPATPVIGDQVTFHAERTNPGKGGDDTFAWDFGDSSPGVAGPDPVHVYTQSDVYNVNLLVTDSDGTSSPADSIQLVVGPNAAPSAAFSFFPQRPTEGQAVSFSGGSDPDGDSVKRLWNFGDGTTDDTPTPTHVYANAGSYTVALTATDQHGAFNTSSQTVTIEKPAGEPPADGSDPGSGAPPNSNPVGGFDLPGDFAPAPGATTPVTMRPFPVVRIAGVVLPRGVVVRILSVRGPRGMRVRVRCHGRGCPVGSATRTSAARLVRLRRFERRLPVRTKLELFVRKPGMIGKYTSFLIRAGAPPKRIDRCLYPTGRSLRRCP